MQKDIMYIEPLLSPSFRQPTHLDVEVLGLHIKKQDRNELGKKNHLRYIRRWEDLLESFEDDLEKCINTEKRKHERHMARKKKAYQKNLNGLFRYEADEIEKGKWDFSESVPSLSPMVQKIKSWTEEWEKAIREELKEREVEERRKLIDLDEDQHAQNIDRCIKKWQNQLKENTQLLESKAYESFEKEKLKIAERELKHHTEILEKRKRELQPKLDLVQRSRDNLTEKNRMLYEEFSGKKVKERSMKSTLNKILSSFDSFIMETVCVNLPEAQRLSDNLLKRNGIAKEELPV